MIQDISFLHRTLIVMIYKAIVFTLVLNVFLSKIGQIWQKKSVDGGLQNT